MYFKKTICSNLVHQATELNKETTCFSTVGEAFIFNIHMYNMIEHNAFERNPLHFVTLLNLMHFLVQHT